MADRESALSPHNLAFLEALYEQHRADPSSVDPEWLPLLEDGEVGTTAPAQNYGASQNGQLQHHVDDLIEAFRLHGHLAADLDPLERPRKNDATILDPKHHGLGEEELAKEVHGAGVVPGTAKVSEIVDRLQRTYCGHIGVEYWHLPSTEERTWLQARMEATQNRVIPPEDEQIRLLRTLTHVETVDSFLHSKFLGAKRFSISGGEATICLLDALIERAGEHQLGEVVFGMAHRGRLNVLMNIMGKSPAEVFSEFEKRDPRELMGAGDVKYHLGYHRQHVTSSGQEIYLALAFNPSHLEAITPVIQGRVRAKQDSMPERGFDASLGVTLHGDSAFAGQGVVAETLNLSELRGYTTGGVIRVVINNQVGFTTDPSDARSGLYATDVAHALQVPVFHVNGNDPEAAAYVAKLAVDYRQRFNRDVIIDLVCYRRFGHNEGDDPTFTQPKMYEIIKQVPSVKESYQKTLLERGTCTPESCNSMEREFTNEFNEALERVRNEGAPAPAISPMHGLWQEYAGGLDDNCPDADTTVRLDTIHQLGPRAVAYPDSFTPHRRLARLLKEQAESYKEGPLSWAGAEILAYATLVHAGHPVRISGQDAGRGTFSHRHARLVDADDGSEYYPLANLSQGQARFEVYNSPLSEFSVLGLEFGYSLAAPYALVVWEAQFGDFANGGQVIIDQFITSCEDKWNRLSGLVMLLPHGYEGQGPEHSSARLERFLQMAAEDNIQVCNFTTPSQIFHALRRQVLRKWRKPLIVMTPKSLLRFRDSFSPLSNFTDRGFQRIFDDPNVEDPSTVEHILACSGKVYYDLASRAEESGIRDKVAIIRCEQLYPFPKKELTKAFERYGNATRLTWAQEEPANMGAWFFVRPLLAQLCDGRFPNPRYAGRAESASPATGSPDSHQLELTMLLDEAFAS